MKIHYTIPTDDAYRARRAAHPLVIAVGFFDGYHRGHQAILRTLLRERRPGERSAVLTFREHPSVFLRPEQAPPMIATLAERINAFARAGLDEAFVLDFDESVAALSPAAFLDEMIVDAIGARALVVGSNFRFGAKRAGDVAFAEAHLRARGRDFVAVENQLLGGERVSSTRIRAAITRGDIDEADRLLAGPYTVRGIVVFGAGRGHDLGFPTANLDVPAVKLLPPDGVYRVTARHEGRDYQGLVSIGTNPTFDGTQRTVEAWLLDFMGSFYGEEVALRDFRFLRAQQRFDSVDALLEQMRADAASVTFPSFTT